MKNDYLSIWYEALDATDGLAVVTSNRQRLRDYLYATRRGYPELGHLSIIFPTNPKELWIVKREEPEG